LGHSSVIYVDDSLLKRDNCNECSDNIEQTKSLGFTTHYKVYNNPYPKYYILGFNIDTISITDKKKRKIFNLCENVLKTNSPKIRQHAF
jgi:hypothetical protein